MKAKYDVVRKKISLDDKVVTNIDGFLGALSVCRVIGFTEQKVRLEYNRTIYMKFPNQIAVVGSYIEQDKEVLNEVVQKSIQE